MFFCDLLQEKEQRECIADLNEALNQKDEAIRILNEEVQRLQTGLSKMSKELEFHGREILRVKNEASRQLRYTSEAVQNNVQGRILPGLGAAIILLICFFFSFVEFYTMKCRLFLLFFFT